MYSDQGVIYVSTGKKHVAMAAMSAKSLKTYCPNLPIHIFSDCEIDSYGCFDSSTLIEPSRANYGTKVEYFLDTPFQKTLYLDSDTRVCDDISHMFELLERYEFAVAHEDWRREKHLKKYFGQASFKHGKHDKKIISHAPNSFLPVNSGVILYRMTDRVMKFFNAWHKTYHQLGLSADQPSLREQLWVSDLKVWILPIEYNCRRRGYIKVLKSANITPKIMHLNDFKKEAGILPKFNELRFKKKIKHIIKRILWKKFINIARGLPF